MKTTLWVLALVLLAATAQGGAPKYIMPEGQKSPPGGRDAAVIVAQTDIQTNIVASQFSTYTQGGAVWALVDANVNAGRTQNAEANVGAIRAGLLGFDVDALANQTTHAISDGVPWFQARSFSFGRDASNDGKSAALDKSNADQMAFFTYVYDINPDFTAVRVSLLIQIANRAVEKGEGGGRAVLAPALAVSGNRSGQPIPARAGQQYQRQRSSLGGGRRRAGAGGPDGGLRQRGAQGAFVADLVGLVAPWRGFSSWCSCWSWGWTSAPPRR